MNVVEQYLRESGKWNVPVDTDWRKRAIQGLWWACYYSAWLDAFRPDGKKTSGLDPGGWTRDADYQEWWITSTPEWDRQWFKANGEKPPKQIGRASCRERV